jgi:diguanylate cyclase (GGDEF)-like protein
METHSRFFDRLTEEEHRRLSVPSAAAAVLIDLLWFVTCVILIKEGSILLVYALMGLAALFYILFLYFVLQPRARRTPNVSLLISLINALGTAILLGATPASAVELAVLVMVAVVVITATLSGRAPAYLYVILTTILGIAFSWGSLNTGIVYWLRFSTLPVMAVLLTETIIRLREMIAEQFERLETINRVTSDLSSTIETPEVIALVSNALKDALKADTYYAAISNGEKLHLELLYDDGQYFPPQEVDLGEGPGAWVIRTGQALLMRNLPVESNKYGFNWIVIGQQKVSLSWMGAPIIAGGEVLGLLSVASYTVNAFSTHDLELLQSVAKQASLALYNSLHHAQVEEQSRLDSLTKVYNHGYFLSCLQEFADYSRETGMRFSLIMLDVDKFKDYNDNYGHQVGDEVLIQLVDMVQENIRSTDIIGRWGGEEFAVLLQEAGGPEASVIAERIRMSLLELKLQDRAGNLVYAPTISQGIAVYPLETEDTSELIHLADKRLYIAKNRGRNQVEPAPAVSESQGLGLNPPPIL